MLEGKVVVRDGDGVIQSGEGAKATSQGRRVIRTDEGQHPLTNFKIKNHYQSESIFNDVCSRNNLPKIKDGMYVINLDECKSVGSHWIDLYVKKIS